MGISIKCNSDYVQYYTQIILLCFDTFGDLTACLRVGLAESHCRSGVGDWVTCLQNLRAYRKVILEI